MTRTQAGRKAIRVFHIGRGHIIGRKWNSQRLPVNQIRAIRAIAKGRGVGPAAIIDDAMNQSTYGKEYRYLNSRPGFEDLEGQQVFTM